MQAGNPVRYFVCHSEAHFATCPLLPRQNQVALAIDAGKLQYGRTR
jgi:uncharacterized protein (DUF1684 family)